MIVYSYHSHYSMSCTKKIHTYLNNWEEKNLISYDQKIKIMEDMTEESSGSWFIKILGTIGAVCVGIGVILVIWSNWGLFPKAVQLIIALLLPIIPLSLGYYFCYVQKDLQTLGNVFAYLGSLLIWASIALIGQIYNTDGTVWSLLLVWLVLALPLLYIFPFKSIVVTCTALFYGVVFYYSTEVFFPSWKDEKYVLAVFTIFSWAMTLLSYTLNTASKKSYEYLFAPIWVISLQILFMCLFIGTLDDSVMFLWEWTVAHIIHNVLFLGVIFFSMWWANKNHAILLRHATFVWLGLWMIAKYFELAWGHLGTWIFFILFGFFLIGIVYGYIKLNAYLWKSDTTSW